LANALPYDESTVGLSLWIRHQARRASAYASPLPTRFRIDTHSCRVEDGCKHPHLPRRVHRPAGKSGLEHESITA
jgi:hypothetical protein